jgi:hypothetical protein
MLNSFDEQCTNRLCYLKNSRCDIYYMYIDRYENYV